MEGLDKSRMIRCERVTRELRTSRIPSLLQRLEMWIVAGSNSSQGPLQSFFFEAGVSEADGVRDCAGSGGIIAADARMGVSSTLSAVVPR